MNIYDKKILFNFYVSELIEKLPKFNDVNTDVLVRVYPDMDAGMTITKKDDDTIIILDCDLHRDVFGKPTALFAEVDFSDIGL